MEEPANRGRERRLAEPRTRASLKITRTMTPALNHRPHGAAKRGASLFPHPSKPRMDSKQD
ncbi:MAG: hypothetical protein JWR14_5433 [Caballeronia sp.]|jgi:hypothetical protein|nr:hypothetical protein [Caballeronia sp.]